MQVVKEKLLLGFMLLLLGASFLALFLDPDDAVSLARGVCVVLATSMLIGICFPARRYLKRKGPASSEEEEEKP